MPKGQTQYVSYATRSRNGDRRKPIIQAGADSGGTYTQTGDGEYTYTFATKAPKDWDQTATHQVGIYGSRNLTEFDLGTSYDDDFFTWVPAGGKAAPRDVSGRSRATSAMTSSASMAGRAGVWKLHHVPHAADHRRRVGRPPTSR